MSAFRIPLQSFPRGTGRCYILTLSGFKNTKRKFETSNVEVKSFPAKVPSLPDKLLKKTNTPESTNLGPFYDIVLWCESCFFFYQLLPTKKHPPPALRGLRPLRLQSLRANAQALRATSVGSPRSCRCQGNPRRQRHAPQPPRRHPVRVPRFPAFVQALLSHGECRWYIRIHTDEISLCLRRDLFHPS